MIPIRILSWNVNGLRAIYKKGFLDWFLKDRPDILCIQETKARPDQLSKEMLHPDESFQAHFSSAQKLGYSGVAVYSEPQPLKTWTGFGMEKFDSEGRTLILEFDSFFLFNIYFPNGKMSPERLKYKMDFYDAFLEYANECRKTGKGIIVCGDVNTAHREIDLARPRENEKISGFLPEERAWIDKFIENGYLDTLRMFHKESGLYTWWDYKSGARERNIGWGIDFFFVGENIRGSVLSASILS